MLRSLFFKLVGAFALVILALAVVVTVLANRATANQFRAYTDRSGQLWAQRLAPALSNYLSSSGTWQGVSAAIQDPALVSGQTNAGSSLSQSLETTAIPSPAAYLSSERPGNGSSTAVVLMTPYAKSQGHGAAGSGTAETQPAPPPTPIRKASPTDPAPSASMGGMGMGMGRSKAVAPVAVPALRRSSDSVMAPNLGFSPAPGALASESTAQGGAQPGPTAGADDAGEVTARMGMHARSRLPGQAAAMGGSLPSSDGTAGQSSPDMWTMMGQRVIIADAGGQVVSDSAGSLQEQNLSAQQLQTGAPIEVGGKPAGTVLVTSADITPETLAGQFLAGVNRSIFVAILAAGVLALGLGSLLFFQITAPVRKLKVAAAAIAAGDLTQRVSVGTYDELGDLAQTFNSMAESLALAEAERRHMVADVAHELRTPLSVMQANLEAMQDGVLPLDAEQIASLHEETVLLARLVADLRLLSLAEAGQLNLERAEVNPDDLIHGAVERLYRKAEERGVALTVENVLPLPPISADADRINQVVGNLVSNALRYTPEGGQVTVQVKSQERQQENRRSGAPHEDVPEVLVSVTDTGTGIAEADVPHIFDRFYRADKSRTRSSGGSGLGLAIVKYLVEAHGGRVWVESPVFRRGDGQGYGTRVSFTLPAIK